MNGVQMQQKKMNIGYLVPSSRDGEVAFVRWQNFLQHNQKKYNIYWYLLEPFPEGVEPPGTVRAIGEMDVGAVARTIKLDRIFILVDLSGYRHKKFMEILMRKPARLQAVFVGRFNTTRLHTVDYLLTDRFCDPDARYSKAFTENLYYLPGSHYCYLPGKEIGKRQRVPFEENGYILFACLHHFARLENSFLRLWANILNSVPDSRLLLRSRIFGGGHSGYICQEMRHRLTNLKFPIDRVEFVSPRIMDHEIYEEVDVILDTYPFQSGTHTCDALYSGIPVISLSGKYHSVRLGYSLLKQIGLIECIAFDQEEYVKKAVELARNPYKILQMRRSLPERMEKSPLMDSWRYISSIERAYETMREDFLDLKKLKTVGEKVLDLAHTIQEGLQYICDHLADSAQQVSVNQIMEEIENAFHNIRYAIGNVKRIAYYQQELQFMLKRLHELQRYLERREYDKAQNKVEAEMIPQMEVFTKNLKKESFD